MSPNPPSQPPVACRYSIGVPLHFGGPLMSRNHLLLGDCQEALEFLLHRARTRKSQFFLGNPGRRPSFFPRKHYFR